MICTVQSKVYRIGTLLAQQVCKYFQDNFIAVYIYGSSVTGDFQLSSDYDFVVIIKTIEQDTMNIVRRIHSELCTMDPECLKLEGGYHLLNSCDPSALMPGVWVEEYNHVETCYLSLEPDSIWTLREAGLVFAGKPAKELFPPVSHEVLSGFCENYISSFEKRLPERLSNSKKFWSALLNVCRSEYYIANRIIATKTRAASWCCERHSDYVPLIEKALHIRRTNYYPQAIADEDVIFALKLVDIIKKSIN